MSGEFTLNAASRTDAGKGASRRLRRLDNKVPAIVYGGNKEPQAITVAINEISKLAEHENFFTSLLTLNIDGAAEQVVIKDMQRHPAKETIMHADFLRVDASTKITMQVPLHFLNAEKSPGVKLQGGNVSYTMQEVEISCLPKDLPEYIEVDMGECNVGDHIHITDLKLPEGVESVALMHGEDHDLQVAAILAPRGGSDAGDEADAAEAESGDADSESSED